MVQYGAYLGDEGGELARLELALVRGVEMVEWLGEVFGVVTEDQEKRVREAPCEADRPRPSPTSVCVELLRWG